MGAENRCKIVAVDGPAGSGKSSVCAQACQRIGWTYVNTGFLYRSIALICRQRQLSFDDDASLQTLIRSFCEQLQWEPEQQAVWYEGRNLAPLLYTDQAGKDASLIAKNPLVRDELLPLQRRLALQSPKGAIVDGRDIGTVVFPDADLKIFMTASIEERARRRIQQLSQGAAVSETDFEAIKSSILHRDQQDAARGAAPLIQAPDAIVFDTSSLRIEDVISQLIHIIRDHGLLP
ncbi:MAG: (d)CMP kinase [Oligoflexus sp.]|jgi:cytidylate kinase